MKQISLSELELALFGTIGVFILLVIGIILFALVYVRKQRQNQAEKELLKQQFESEKLAAQLEISEQTMQELSHELHDNIGQRISVAIQRFRKDFGDKHDLNEVLDDTLNDLRQLSKNMNGSYLEKVGIDLAIEKECKRVQDSTEMTCTYTPTDDYLALSPDQEVILFRCYQELVSNAIKHSNAKNLAVKLLRKKDDIILSVSDDGKGINPKSVESGIGMISLENRVKILKGKFTLKSKDKKGTLAKITIPTLTSNA